MRDLGEIGRKGTNDILVVIICAKRGETSLWGSPGAYTSYYEFVVLGVLGQPPKTKIGIFDDHA